MITADEARELSEKSLKELENQCEEKIKEMCALGRRECIFDKMTDELNVSLIKNNFTVNGVHIFW